MCRHCRNCRRLLRVFVYSEYVCGGIGYSDAKTRVFVRFCIDCGRPCYLGLDGRNICLDGGLPPCMRPVMRTVGMDALFSADRGSMQVDIETESDTAHAHAINRLIHSARATRKLRR
jgi:hypothetical protein